VVKDFDIHGLVKLRLEWDFYRAILEDLDLKLNYFRVAEVDRPDILVSIGPFKPTLEGCEAYDGKYFVRKDFVYCTDRNFQCRWEFQLSGLSGSQLVMNVHASSYNARAALAPNLLVHTLLMPLLEWEFLKRGFLLLHSAAVSKDGQAYIIAGRGGAFKTSVVMDLVRREGYGYMSDERALVAPHLVFSFPTHLQIFAYCLSKLSSEYISPFDKLRLLAYLLANRLGKEREIVVDSSQLVGIAYLSPSTEPFQLRRLDVEAAASKMMANAFLDNFEMPKIVGLGMSPILGCLMAYVAAFPKSRIANIRSEFMSRLRQTLTGLPIYEMTIPLTYGADTARFVREVLTQ